MRKRLRREGKEEKQEAEDKRWRKARPRNGCRHMIQQVVMQELTGYHSRLPRIQEHMYDFQQK